MHNYYLDFLKSLKRYIGSVFPEIEHYQFNYADYAFLNYKLYEEHVKEYPMCMINLTDITTEDNHAFMRFIGNKHSVDTAQLLANNHTKKDSIVMDFKWVTMQVQIKINLNSVADLFNCHNVLISEFPKNFMFYSYKYNALINVDDVTKSWDVSDETEGLVYRTIEQSIEAFCTYNIEPIFRVNSIVKNKIINDDISLDVNLEIKLKVPNKIGNLTLDDRILNGIQIVMSGAEGTTDSLPILIDMDNDLFSDRQMKLSRSYIIDKLLFNTEENSLDLPYNLYDIIDKHVGVYMVDDSTLNVPSVLWTELFLTDSDTYVIQEFQAEVQQQDAVPYTPADGDIPEILEVPEVLYSEEVPEILGIRIKLDDDIKLFNFNDLNNLQLLQFS